MFQVIIADRNEKVIFCKEKEDVLAAARRQGVMIPQGCRGGGCGMCKIRVEEGNFERGTSSMAVLSEEERRQNYSLSCKTYPQSDLRIVIDHSSRPTVADR
jgi:ferredoxin